MNKLLQIIHRKRLAYANTFRDATGSVSPYGQTVLADLKRYCGINRGGLVISPVSRMADPIATAYRAGQRDVYLRVAKMLGLDETDILEEHDHESDQAST